MGNKHTTLNIAIEIFEKNNKSKVHQKLFYIMDALMLF